MTILVVIDHDRGAAKPVSWEVMGRARCFADRLGEELVGFYAGSEPGDVAPDAIAYGADRVLAATGPALASFDLGAYTAAFKAAIAAVQPAIILIPSAAGLHDVAALAACELGIGLAVDCQGLALDEDGHLLADRPVFSGSMVTTVTFRGTPQMATIRPRSFPLPARNAARSGRVEALAFSLDDLTSREEVLGFQSAQTGELSVENAGIIVAGGRGVKGSEGFAPLRELAAVLGGAVAASRAAVDAGWIPYAHQVGQTGKAVRPDLYIACGISGAIQHLAGMAGSRVIVAINRDRDAPIFGIAQYGLIGDLFELAPALTAALKARLGR